MSIARRLVGFNLLTACILGVGGWYAGWFGAHAVAAPSIDFFGDIDFNELEQAELLVVDDNGPNRDLIAGYFEKTDHQLRFAVNGVEAVEKIREKLPNLVLMDIRMPEMDGHTALMELRKIPGTELLPVVAVTASSMIDDEQVLRGYFAGYVRKPFSRQALFHELAAFLPRRSQRTVPTATEPAGRAAPERVAPQSRPDLIPALRELEEGRWREVSDSGAINDVRNFAQRLAELGANADCAPLREYGAALLKDSEEYAILRMEQRLRDYPKVIQSLAPPPAGASPPSTASTLRS